MDPTGPPQHSEDRSLCTHVHTKHVACGSRSLQRVSKKAPAWCDSDFARLLGVSETVVVCQVRNVVVGRLPSWRTELHSTLLRTSNKCTLDGDGGVHKFSFAKRYHRRFAKFIGVSFDQLDRRRPHSWRRAEPLPPSTANPPRAFAPQQIVRPHPAHHAGNSFP